MSKDSIAVINGHEYKYRWNSESKEMDYLGPVGDSPPLSESLFREAMLALTVDEFAEPAFDAILGDLNIVKERLEREFPTKEIRHVSDTNPYKKHGFFVQYEKDEERPFLTIISTDNLGPGTKSGTSNQLVKNTRIYAEEIQHILRNSKVFVEEGVLDPSIYQTFHDWNRYRGRSNKDEDGFTGAVESAVVQIEKNHSTAGWQKAWARTGKPAPLIIVQPGQKTTGGFQGSIVWEDATPDRYWGNLKVFGITDKGFWSKPRRR
jgi:hypothetical protein